jgi:hypothetical protein
MGAFTGLPRWIAVGKNKRAGFVWRDSATGLWHAHCAKGRLAFGTVEEAERAITRWPAEPPQPPQQKPRVKPLDHSRLSDLRSGFIVRDGNGRELGGAIGRPDGCFDGFALGENIGRFADAAMAAAEIRKAAERIRRERREARKARREADAS